ncbi:NUDIX hydrolase [Actinoplanes sp. ATCC 53533]|uniref:NUDIX hydrolase n=1 Tax=Actinoplanes sp. ATCC 53533 TaxID=1288362 RepID=UPI001F44271A|nr:NUDIX hydrolase [Actinoplanes sp. ATCC 53533]
MEAKEPVSGYDTVRTAALAIVPGADATITFVHQQRGPYAGHWLLPGGQVEFGESLPDAARRETLEESGCRIDKVTLTGVYEMRGQSRSGAYHVIMFAFLAGSPVAVPTLATTDEGVGEIVQGDPAVVRPHPTVMRILNDAGVARFDQAEIDELLDRDGITMVCMPTAARTVFA